MSPAQCLHIAFYLLLPLLTGAQSYTTQIDAYLRNIRDSLNLTDRDIREYTVSDQYTQQATGLTYTYLHQQVGNIRIFGAVSTLVIRDNQVVHFANRFVENAAEKAHTLSPVLTPVSAITAAAAHLQLAPVSPPIFLRQDSTLFRWHFEVTSLSSETVTTELVLLPVNGALQLAWNVSIDVKNSPDWWNVRIDALSGAFLSKNNWTRYCDFGCTDPISHFKTTRHSPQMGFDDNQSQASSNWQTGSYRVYPLPVEAPSFGQRELLADPFSTIASPLGWHDTDGQAGAEYTTTRGNNVHAYEDENDNNEPGESPDGGAGFVFDYPIDFSQPPSISRDAIITNLFYMNNMIHDILYLHGFDEASGNFQEHNFGTEGEDTDYVRAEAQDGGGTNNANFSTPPDGNRGRMQMYLWNGGGVSTLTINAPPAIAGDYVALEAAFGPGITDIVAGEVEMAEDDTPPIHDGCGTIVNGTSLQGKIAVIDRTSDCTFLQKVQAAEAAGAIAAVIVNNAPGDAITMGGFGVTNIPSVMISQEDGQLIKDQILAGETVLLTLTPPVSASIQLDGSLDNGIIAHEYGHGLSNRLTGGPSNSDCLDNAEQGGEGWSDYLALLLTIEPDDEGTDGRGIGTYALGQATVQVGIRRYRYSTDMAINPQTYADLTLSSQVHDIGEIWCQSLWDMTWNLIGAEGFDPDWFNGQGGNHTALRLVIEGMKLQPCNPGYIDARDAILAADALLYDSAHHCLIWEAFAKRGMGQFADQGDNDDAGDETPDFTLPPICFNPTQPPVAFFTVNAATSCFGYFEFTDLSTDIPQQWHWDFGDGQTSTSLHPTHIYSQPGNYTVVLTVSNSFGSDQHEMSVMYTELPVPILTGVTEICPGASTLLTAQVDPGNSARWYINGDEVFEGVTFQTPSLSTNTVVSARQINPTPVLQVGPADNSFGAGGNQATPFEGKLLFEAFIPFRLISVLVYAQGEAMRTFTLYDADNTAIQTVTVLVPDGESRVHLSFEIPYPGLYSIGNAGQNLYRNNNGASYPYAIDGLLSINSSNSAANPLAFYYYFYDWEVQESPCSGPPTEIAVTLTPGPLASFDYAASGLQVSFTDLTSGNVISRQWDFGDGSPLVDEVNPIHTYSQTGTYTVALTATDGSCTHTATQQVELTGSTGIAQLNEENVIWVYPNPAQTAVWVQIESSEQGPWQLQWTDAQGIRVVSHIMRGTNPLSLVETGSWPAGVYFCTITGQHGTNVVKVAVIK